MEQLSDTHFAKAKKAGQALNAASKSMRVLSSVEWSAGCRSRFLEKGKLPNPRYAKVDTSKTRDYIKEARAQIEGDHVVFEWLGTARRYARSDGQPH